LAPEHPVLPLSGGRRRPEHEVVRAVGTSTTG